MSRVMDLPLPGLPGLLRMRMRHIGGNGGAADIELKANFLGTAHAADRLTVYATAVHRGGTTQIWDASVKVRRTDADPEKPIAVFRCTQLLLDPR